MELQIEHSVENFKDYSLKELINLLSSEKTEEFESFKHNTFFKLGEQLIGKDLEENYISLFKNGFFEHEIKNIQKLLSTDEENILLWTEIKFLEEELEKAVQERETFNKFFKTSSEENSGIIGEYKNELILVTNEEKQQTGIENFTAESRIKKRESNNKIVNSFNEVRSFIPEDEIEIFTKKISDIFNITFESKDVENYKRRYWDDKYEIDIKQLYNNPELVDFLSKNFVVSSLKDLEFLINPFYMSDYKNLSSYSGKLTALKQFQKEVIGIGGEKIDIEIFGTELFTRFMWEDINLIRFAIEAKKKAGFNIFLEYRNFGYLDAKLLNLKEWMSDKKLFYWALENDFFKNIKYGKHISDRYNMDKEYSSYVHKYKLVRACFNNKQVYNFIKNNRDLYPEISRYLNIGSLYLWAENPELWENVEKHMNKSDQKRMNFFHYTFTNVENLNPNVLNKLFILDIFVDPFKIYNDFLYLEDFSVEDVKDLHEFFKNKPNTFLLFSNNSKLLQKFLEMDSENRVKYLSVIDLVSHSPSSEMQRLKDEISFEILNSANPLETFQRIEGVFLEPYLPTFGKKFAVFQKLYNTKRVHNMLAASHLSPVLKNADLREKYTILFTDLLRINIDSGNKNLMNFLKEFQNEELNIPHSQFFLNQITSLLSVIAPSIKVENSYEDAKIFFNTKNGELLIDSIVSFYLKDIPLHSVQEVLEYSKNSKNEATERNKLLPNQLNLQKGDLVKGVDDCFLDNILSEGAVSREFLGGGSDSDLTPFDSDFIKIDKNISLKESNHSNITGGYGNITLVVNDRGQYSDKYLEQVHSGIVSENHYGIRTGIPSSEISAIIVSEDDKKVITDTKNTIARNGQYISLINDEGKNIFSFEEYEKLQIFFNGITEYSNKNIKISKNLEFAEKNELVKNIKNEEENVKIEYENIKNKIITSLSLLGIKQGKSLKDAKIYDTGSTGRLTNDPSSNYDFDLALQVNYNDFKNRGPLLSKFSNEFSGDDNGSFDTTLRLKNVDGVNNKNLEIDITVAMREIDSEITSGEAISQKLENIKNTQGEEVYYAVLANIIHAKRVLKENGVYKKNNGGFGGIGVENWILSNGGSFAEALESLKKTAHQTSSFEEFKEKYPILDAGRNLKYGIYDNFIEKLNEQSLKVLLQI